MANELRAPRAPCEKETPLPSVPPSESPPSFPLRELTGAFVQQNTPRFLIFARRLIDRYGGGEAILGKEPHDYVVDALVKLWSGRRRRPEHVPLTTCIYKIIAALIFRDLGRPESRVPHARVDTAESEDDSATFDVADAAADTEEVLIADNLAEEFILASKYPKYIELRLTGLYTTAAEYARAMDVTEAEIHVMNRYLQRNRNRWKGMPAPH